MSRAGAGQIDDWRAGLATQLEMLRDEVRQGHQAIIERLARIEATLDEPNNLKRKNSGGRPSKFAWRDFYIEALRLEYNDEIQSRHHLQEHMEKWVTEQWTDQPDLRTIRREVAAIAETLHLI
jgi:hypothetical protein